MNDDKQIDEIKEEYDTSISIWTFYKKIYEWNQNSGESAKYWNLELESIDKHKERRWAIITSEGKEHYGIVDDASISGDIVFNFSSGKHYTKKANKYRKILENFKDEDEEKKKLYMKKLNKCIKSHHSKANCSLLLSSGNMQAAKKKHRK